MVRGAHPTWLLRLRLEGDHHQRHAEFVGLLRQLPQHRLMTRVHTIEIANGGDTALVVGAQIVDAAG